ncbi:MAG: acetylxylan esterase [Lentisphaeria bacterium]|nr:acetylxylan esterase [Lentisphaeria bacterium]
MVKAGCFPVRASRKSAVYFCGEEICFKSVPGARGIYIVNDGEKDSLPVEFHGDIMIHASKPGFILLKVQGRYRNGRAFETLAGAAVEPEKIVPGTRCPADFDEFWQIELSRLKAGELQVTSCKPVDEKFLPGDITAFDVHLSRNGIEASGFLAMPRNAGCGSLPGVLSFLGASKVSGELEIAVKDARKLQAAAFNLNFHGLENFPERLSQLLAPAQRQVANYQFISADDPQKYAMRKIFLRGVIAADFIKSLPQYNGNLSVWGGSLGGCQSIVAAVLNPDVKFCWATASAMSDHHGRAAGHLPGWPDLLASPLTADGAAAVSPYFDVVNFASRIKCPVVMGVGFIDRLTPPASTYAAYNSLTVKRKRMLHTVTGGHGPLLDKREVCVFDLGREFFEKAVKKQH